MRKPVRILGACSGWGLQNRACEKAPELLQKEMGKLFNLAKIEMLYPEKKGGEDVDFPCTEALPLIHAFNRKLAKRVTEVLDGGEFPIILGGDHVNAVGTWNGVNQHLIKKSLNPLGLIWLDAHMDAHTPETSLSGAWHGMPLAALLGYGDPQLSQLISPTPVLAPERVALIGVRSFEAGEALLLKDLNVRIYFLDEVKRRGLKDVLLEAIGMMRNLSLGVTLDLDVVDPQDAPGVNTPEPYGISAKELLGALPLLDDPKHLIAFELVEYNPDRDISHKTQDLACAILKEFVK